MGQKQTHDPPNSRQGSMMATVFKHPKQPSYLNFQMADGNICPYTLTFYPGVSTMEFRIVDQSDRKNISDRLSIKWNSKTQFTLKGFLDDGSKIKLSIKATNSGKLTALWQRSKFKPIFLNVDEDHLRTLVENLTLPINK